MIQYVFLTFVILIPGFLLAAAITSFIENEHRAGMIFLVFTLVSFSFMFIPATLTADPQLFHLLTVCVSGLLLLALLLPFKGHIAPTRRMYGPRFHEADAVLSRRKLIPGTKVYAEYYAAHPAFRDPDERARRNPGLLSEKSAHYDPVTFAAAKANFRITEHLHTLENIPPDGDRNDVDTTKITHFIRSWLLNSGAHDVGFTALKDHHLYSHKGRGPRRGEPIKNSHPHAIAITVEMNREMMQYAPAGPTVMESANCYLSSGMMASSLALMIRELGYDARAHIDGNYEVICPLVAADAGLGEIGRMGLLMTPRLGPRVRIAVVTTNLPMMYPVPETDPTVVDFCRRCRKCAQACPVAAIPTGDPQVTNDSMRWQINSEKCYNFWTITGTDCGRCVISCPYSHPDNWLHRLTRRGIKNNLFFRIMAAKLDDVFYGRKPGSRELPERLRFRSQT